MAQINLTVVAETAEELKSILLDLADIVDATATVVSETTGAGAVALSGEVVPAKSGRKGRPAGSKNKPKVEPTIEPTEEEKAAAAAEVRRIEAEKAEQARRDELAAAERKSDDKVESLNARTVANTPADVATANPLPPTEPEPSNAPAATEPKTDVEAVRAALKVLVKGKGRDAAMDILRKYGTDRLDGIKAEDFGAVLADAQAAVA